MARLLARRRGLDDASRVALRGVLKDPIFELLPLKNLADQVPHLPRGARVSVTASPAKGIDATVDWATAAGTATPPPASSQAFSAATSAIE